jgi:uncharacterized protein
MKNILSLAAALCIGFLSSILVACSTMSPSVSFYTLAPLDEKTEHYSVNEASSLQIRVMLVEIPDYLDRPEIMTKKGPNTVQMAEFNRWAGSFRDNITAVLAENLGLLLKTDLVFVQPPVDIRDIDYRVALQILRLDSRLGDQVLLKAKWTVSPVKDMAPAATEVANFVEPLHDADYETLAAGISRTLEQVSREIAETIMSLSKEK